ncbi:hypothetical protein P7D23_10195 [Lactococcus petauri]|uniref:Uncharacterized protein n=1 Tax=Lactococcus petauri TaxID=1940789 RepID=A0AAJ2MPA4_9LACT|nr:MULTISPECIES: hypothetical protein [Lactococcus]MDT2528053.1 hypothetical protein [Lactococcus petauri]MDT2561277.1 hypothetical protein [Lactococcus petauri]MDT2586670.1 hypothetical protein [Lactococcus petauri]MDT2667605.1 hypothetical protein [Lactococcus petauri]
MASKINIQLSKERHPELFKYFEENEGSPLQVLERLLNENKSMKFSLDERQDLLSDFSKMMLKELIPIRLALRTTEKQTWMLSQLKNTEIIERNIWNTDRPYPKPRTLQENTSEAFALLDTTWEEFIKAKQVEYASRTNKKLEQYENELREQ